MKFGKRLTEDLCEPGWQDSYLRYRLLKKVIKVLTLVGPSSQAALLAEALSVFPKKNEILVDLSEDTDSCIVCKRWNVFAKLLKADLAHADNFFISTLERLETTLHKEVLPDIDKLINDRKQEITTRGSEPKLYPGSSKLEPLARFAFLSDTIAALKRFVVVNTEATRKITKKFKKHVIKCPSIGNECCGPSCALILRFDDSAPFDDLDHVSSDEDFGLPKFDNPQQTNGFGDARKFLSESLREKAASLMPIIAMEDRCKLAWETMLKLEQELSALDVQIMVECSTFYDYVVDTKTQLQMERRREQLVKVEERQEILTRLTQHIDLDNHTIPANFLVIGVVLPLVTLAATYYISMGIYVDEAKSDTVFDEKGWFISASIDRAPAANIGTLGLTTTLSFLAVIIFLKHKIVKKQLRGRVFMRTHRVATLLGMMSIFCGNGVAAFQHQWHAAAHNSFATGFFFLGMIHVVLETVLDYTLQLSTSFTRKLRAIIALVLILCVTMFLGLMGYVLVYPVEDEYVLMLFKNVAAAFEVGAFICFVIWFGSYYMLLKSSQFELHVVTSANLEAVEEIHQVRHSMHHQRQLSSDSLDGYIWGELKSKLFDANALGGGSSSDLDSSGDDYDTLDPVESKGESQRKAKIL